MKKITASSADFGGCIMESEERASETKKMRPALIDSFGRRIEYVRLSVTDKCNLRCFYCLPKGFKDFEHKEQRLTFDEIERIVRAFGELGVSRIRITGGEPLIRKDLPLLAKRLSALRGIEDLSLSTNATLLASHTTALRQAGIARLNVSLDSLQPERFERITGGRLEPVLAGLMAAKHAGFRPIKINMVALRNVNDDEFEDMVEFCLVHGFVLRLIEIMPMGSTGGHASQHYLDLQIIKEKLARKFDLVPSAMPGGGPARYYQVGGTNLHIGLITPISQHFCETCNRVRLAVDGTLYLCLGQDHRYELRPLLRQGVSDAGLKEAIVAAIAHKPARHEFRGRPRQLVRFMSMTGG